MQQLWTSLQQPCRVLGAYGGETGHSSFRGSGGNGQDDRSPNPMACAECGHHCANRAESWVHTEATGHAEFCSIRGIEMLEKLHKSRHEMTKELERLIGRLTHADHAAGSRVGNTRVLYHQTSPAAAETILRSQKMLAGNSGLAGGGIYFAETKEATNQKAHQRGAFLRATVHLGRVKEVNRSAESTTLSSLKREGYDSVKILGRASGAEYVVYSWGQVTDIQRV
ncbi:unnamed protein product [Effrenium voratum]|nr:unnamed protein product [Effrenium voratum]